MSGHYVVKVIIEQVIDAKRADVAPKIGRSTREAIEIAPRQVMPVTTVVTAAPGISDAIDKAMRLLEVEKGAAESAPDLRYPTDRPRWLGVWQPWPCSRCGKEESNGEPHDCQPLTDATGETP